MVAMLLLYAAVVFVTSQTLVNKFIDCFLLQKNGKLHSIFAAEYIMYSRKLL